jgi:hypothetical protein
MKNISDTTNISSDGSFFAPDGARFLIPVATEKLKIKRAVYVDFVLHVSTLSPAVTSCWWDSRRE